MSFSNGSGRALCSGRLGPLRVFLLLGWLLLPAWSWGASAPSQLPLSGEQRGWLEQHRQLRVGVVLQAPYAQFERRQQRLSGANIELMNWLAASLQVELVWQHYADQAGLEAALRAEQIDLAPGLSQTPAGLRLWLYSDPYLRVPQLLVGERNANGAVDLERLDATQPVAVRQPSAVADYLRATYSNLRLQAVSTERQALQSLLAQQASYAVVDQAQLGRLSREAEFAGLAVVGDIGLPQLLRVASRRDWPQLAALIEVALRGIPRKDLEQLHERWLQTQYPRLAESPGFWQNLSLLLALLLLAAVASLVWL
ncbi:MAG: transporter substrate-binding domain-containing protein, partial [Pseudomonas sp.]